MLFCKRKQTNKKRAIIYITSTVILVYDKRPPLLPVIGHSSQNKTSFRRKSRRCQCQIEHRLGIKALNGETQAPPIPLQLIIDPTPPHSTPSQPFISTPSLLRVHHHYVESRSRQTELAPQSQLEPLRYIDADLAAKYTNTTARRRSARLFDISPPGGLRDPVDLHSQIGFLVHPSPPPRAAVAFGMGLMRKLQLSGNWANPGATRRM